MSETAAHRYLMAALQSPQQSRSRPRREVLPFHRAMVAYQLCRSQLANVATPSGSPRPHNRDLAHVPVLLSPLAWPTFYDYAVHRRSTQPGSLERCPTWLLIYRQDSEQVSFLELHKAHYTLVLALQLALQDHCPLTATELLLELAEQWDTDNVVLFVEQALKLLSRMNDLGLIHSARNEQHPQPDVLHNKL